MYHVRMYAAYQLLLLETGACVAQTWEVEQSVKMPLTRDGSVCFGACIDSHLQIIQGAGQAETFGASKGAPG